MESDHATHVYTLILSKDNTYEVQIDGTKAESGSLYDDFDFLLPKTIKDPAQKKPSDWVDNAEMPDPSDVKPAGYDDVPAKIPDSNAKKPEDWDDEEDGEWVAPQVDNPEYKGPWKAKSIPNPAYKGPWVQPEIANPDYVDDATVYNVCNPCSHVGFELWQVKAGTIFDDIIVADSLTEVEAFIASTSKAKASKEVAKREEKDAAEKKAQEEAAAAAKAAADAKKEEEADNKDEDEEL
jgi:calreticulin